MAYITKANSKLILRKIEFKDWGINGRIYETPIYIFNKKEEQSLLAYKEFLMNPNKFVNEIYSKMPKREDTFSYVYENATPCYHASMDCERLCSEFRNYRIPDVIRNRGTLAVIEYRTWFRDNEYLLDDKATFEMRFHLRWGFRCSINEIVKTNSGIHIIENWDLDNLQEKLNAKIKEAGRYYYANAKNTTILKQYGKRTFLGHYRTDVPLMDNRTGYSDEEVRRFLCNYEENYKNPIYSLLQDYYRVKYNPELSMSGKLLEQLGFRECSHCKH